MNELMRHGVLHVGRRLDGILTEPYLLTQAGQSASGCWPSSPRTYSAPLSVLEWVKGSSADRIFAGDALKGVSSVVRTPSLPQGRYEVSYERAWKCIEMMIDEPGTRGQYTAAQMLRHQVLAERMLRRDDLEALATHCPVRN